MKSTRSWSSRLAALVVCLALGSSLWAVPPASAEVGAASDGITSRVSVASDGTEGNGNSGMPSVSADGRFVAFHSDASTLVADDTNGVQDVFVHDTETGQTERVSVASDGNEGDGESGYPSISADGRFVAFHSEASNFAEGDTNDSSDIFVHDRETGQTERVSVSTEGLEANWSSYSPSISADGRFVAFRSFASTLVLDDTNIAWDIFVHDRETGETTRVSVASDGTESDGDSEYLSISGDGRFVAFHSNAANLVPDDANGKADIFVHDRETGETERVSVASDGTESDCPSSHPSISADGRWVAFHSCAANLVPGVIGANVDVFVHDRDSGQTECVSMALAGAVGDGNSLQPAISAGGRSVAFYSYATNLVEGDTNSTPDVFVYDLETGETTRVSVTSAGDEVALGGEGPAISARGGDIAFASGAPDLVTGDTNGRTDIFLHSRANTEPEELSISGRVTDARTGEPVAGLKTRVASDDDPAARQFVTTDEDGRYAIEFDPEGAAWRILVLVESDNDPAAYPYRDYESPSFVAADSPVVHDIALTPRGVEVIEVAGAGRYATAVEASKLAYPEGAQTVVIATGRNWPDALGGSALAGALDAPILLVTTNSVPEVVLGEIGRLEASTAVIVGGTAAVAPEVATELALQGLSVQRVAGGNRYETADAVALRVITELGAEYDGTAFVATGGAYPDAVAAGPLAAAKGWPLYLAHPTGGLRAPTLTAMTAVTDALVLGGEAAVSADTHTTLVGQLGAEHVKRLSGGSRYETAVKIAEHGVENAGRAWNRVGIATGQAYPDALAGGVLQGKAGSVMLLTRSASLSPETAETLLEQKAAISTVTYFGGELAVSVEVRAAVARVLE